MTEHKDLAPDQTRDDGVSEDRRRPLNLGLGAVKTTAVLGADVHAQRIGDTCDRHAEALEPNGDCPACREEWEATTW